MTIIERKEVNGKNVEFKAEHCLFGISTESLTSIINKIENGTFYYTKNKDGSNSVVLVKDDNSDEKYITSKANDGDYDNIDSLPTYK